MRRFIFKLEIIGDGKTVDEAFKDALSSPESFTYDESTELCDDCQMELDECTCEEDAKEGFLGDKWLEAADEESERIREER